MCNFVLFFNAIEIYQFKTKDTEIKKKSIVFRKYFRKFFSQQNEKTGLNGCVYDFSVDYRAFDTSNIISIHKYFMTTHILWKVFVGLLDGLVNVSDCTKWVSLSKQNWMIQPIVINLHPTEYSQELY